MPNDNLNSKLGVFIGDITCLEIDCIVNAANKTLLGRFIMRNALQQNKLMCIIKKVAVEWMGLYIEQPDKCF